MVVEVMNDAYHMVSSVCGQINDIETIGDLVKIVLAKAV